MRCLSTGAGPAGFQPALCSRGKSVLPGRANISYGQGEPFLTWRFQWGNAHLLPNSRVVGIEHVLGAGRVGLQG